MCRSTAVATRTSSLLRALDYNITVSFIHSLIMLTHIYIYIYLFTQTTVPRTTFKQNWLSDASTYPLIVVMSGALALVGGVSAYYLSVHPDVQINPNKRNSLLRTWGADK